MGYSIYDGESRYIKAKVSTAGFAQIDARTSFRPAIVSGELRLVVLGDGFEYDSHCAGITVVIRPGDFFIKNND